MKRPLYQLPGYGRMTFRQEVLRGLFLAFLATAVWAGMHTQFVAHYFAYPQQFGTPLFAAPAGWTLWLIVGAGAAAVAAAGILFWATNKAQAGFFVLLALLFSLAAAAPVYQPFAFFGWTRGWQHLAAYQGFHARVRLSFWIGCAAIAGGYVVFLALQARRLRERGHTHGSAAWAKRKDIERAGLFAQTGIILGLWEEPRRRPEYLRSTGTHSVFVQGPPRSGKSTGVVLPTLLTWPGSALVHDAKGELWGLTAGYRAAGDGLAGQCLRFDPTNAADGSARYNPLLEIRPGPEEVGDVQNIAALLADPQGQVRVSSASEEYFRTSAQRLIGAAILHVLYAEPDKTLGRVTSLLSGTGGSFADALNRMAGTVHLPVPDDPALAALLPADVRAELATVEPRTHPHVLEVAGAMAATDYRTLSNIQSTALAALDIYQDPLVRRNTRTSDFRVRDLMHADRPVTLYLTVPASDVDRARPLVRLLLSQALRTLMYDLEIAGGRAAPSARHQLLLLLDELPLLGYLDIVPKALSFGPGYGIRALLCVQGLSQHRAIYGVHGRDETIVGSCDIRVCLGANDAADATYFSDLAGKTTVHREKRDYRGKRFDVILDQQFIRSEESQRPLIFPDEILRLPSDDVLVFARSAAPVRGTRVKSYEDRVLRDRTMREAPEPRPLTTGPAPGDQTFWAALGAVHPGSAAAV